MSIFLIVCLKFISLQKNIKIITIFKILKKNYAIYYLYIPSKLWFLMFSIAKWIYLGEHTKLKQALPDGVLSNINNIKVMPLTAKNDSLKVLS